MKKEFNKFVKVFYDHLTNRLGYDDISKYEYRKTNELRYDLDYIKKMLKTKKEIKKNKNHIIKFIKNYFKTKFGKGYKFELKHLINLVEKL